MLIQLFKYSLFFFRKRDFTDSSLTNFGKTFETLLALDSISSKFGK